MRDFRSRSHNVSGPQQIRGSSRRSVSWCLPITLGNATWEKYKIGESLKIIDPETKASAIKNPFLRPKAGVLVLDDMALDRLLERGVVFGACNMAPQVQSKVLAGNAGITAEEAAKEWAANVIQHHDHPAGNLGREPRPGNGLHLLRWRLMPPLGMWEVVSLRPVDFVNLTTGLIGWPRRYSQIRRRSTLGCCSNLVRWHLALHKLRPIWPSGSAR
jgi:hypothetical protein